MNKNEILDKLLLSFTKYYDVSREAEIPFVAKATFSLQDEQYFLVKSAKIGEIHSNEYVYFAQENTLDKNTIHNLSNIAWDFGTKNIKPHLNHKSSDVVLFVITDKICEEAQDYIKKINLSKSYKFGFWGYSHYKLVVIELSTQRIFCNRRGKVFKKTVKNVLDNHVV